VVILLAVQTVALLAFGLFRGYGIVHTIAEVSLVGASVVLARWRRLGRTAQMSVATMGLMVTSALAVHFSGGSIEAHFHFFVMIGVISLYQAWEPFLFALAFVVAHHGLLGWLFPEAVYNHTAARTNPWGWALIHAAYVLAASMVNMIAWHLNETVRDESDLLLESAGEGIFGLNPAGRITFINRAGAAMLGALPDTLLGRGYHSIVSGGIEPDVLGSDSETLSSEFVRADGAVFPVELTRTLVHKRDAVVGEVITFRDVSEQVAAHKQLNHTLSLLEATLESTADGILVVNGEGKITSLNRKFAHMWRIPEDILASGDDDRALAHVLDQLKDPQGFLAKVHELYAKPDAESFDLLEFKDGRIFERLSQPQRVDGISIGRVWSFRDVTERNRLEELRNGFLAAVSHELRTPLTSVLGWALTLESRGESLEPAERQDLLARLSMSARKLERLLADTLDLDRLSRGILEPVRTATDLGALVQSLLAETDIVRGRMIQFDAVDVVASVDRAKIERIIENLLINALRYTDDDVQVWVRLSVMGEDALITVEDAGDGVPADIKEEIFEEFRQGPNVRPSAPGVGIGLSLVARFAALHGGRAWVEDRAGGGASFKVLLPACVLPADALTVDEEDHSAA
jgi:PAS domain S-box-containing protein